MFALMQYASVSAKEPSEQIIGMLMFLNNASEISDLDVSDYNRFMKEDYNYEIKQISPKNSNHFKVGFDYYLISNESWNGIIAVWDDSEIYRLKGFFSNDFATFFSNYKYECRFQKMSDRKLLKTLEGIGVDFKCLYKANKKFEGTIKENHPCVMRKSEDHIIKNCFK